MKIRVLIADDHGLFRNALRMSLEQYPDIEIVGEAIDGREVADAALEKKPQVICMDFSMPKLNGIEASKQLLLAVPNAKIICLSANIDLHLVSKMLHAGAVGFVEKAQAATELYDAIRAVYQNKYYFSTRLGITNATMLSLNLCQGLSPEPDQF